MNTSKENLEFLSLVPPYLGSIFDDVGFQTVIDIGTQQLRKVDFDTMICTGLSGILIAPTLARALGKHCLIIRKSISHSQLYVAGYLGHKWIFVDDFVLTGATLNLVLHRLDELLVDWQHEMIGVYEYAQSSFTYCSGLASFTRLSK